MKRIFTLLAGFALFGVMTAMAQTTDPPIKLKLGANEGLYQLEIKGGGVLSVRPNFGLKAVTLGTPYSYYLVRTDQRDSFYPLSYWCVTVTQENKGQTPIYDFINKGAQCFLDVSMDVFEDDSKTTNHGYVFFDSGDVPYTDVKDGYVRVAFLPAIHITDTLIILTPEDAMVAPDSLNPAALIAKYQASKNPAVKMNIIPLTGDNHKNVTWSFRYTNPGKGAKVTAEGPDNSFLIESNNNDGQNIAPEYAA